jgi:5-methylcytosine-specific restriction endonuclease McrA
MTNRQNRRMPIRRGELMSRFGGKCSNCGSTEELQFAHIRETKLNGRGRGRKERLYDIIKNPLSYRLLCKKCHEMFDEMGLEIYA